MRPDVEHSAGPPRLTARAAVLACLVAAASPGGLCAQEEGEGRVSRSMDIGIQMFEKGDDARAMDRFMEVITKGDPAERPLANEYINLITRRMNSGEKPAPRSAAVEPTRPAVERPAASAEVPASEKALVVSAPSAASREVIVESDQEIAFNKAPAPARASASVAVTPPVAAAAIAPSRPAASSEAQRETPRATKALMIKEIRAKTKALKEKSLKQLKALEDVSVLMSDAGDPLAVGIPSALLFGSGIGFQKSAGAVLDALTGLVYSLSGAQIVVLPEGTAVGDAKVMDMRRTMGISAHLFSAGIAPPRVKVNLLNTQVDIPRAIQDFKGIIIVFVYNQPLALVVESPLGEEAGPPLSLGVFPENIRAEKGEGAIIEFSVQDPPAGLVSWEFKLLAPSVDGAELAPLQEVVGGGPVYHQIYWNGRQNYFGSVLKAGRYECVLTATDAKNRQRTLHRWIHLIGAAPAAPAAAPVSREEASASPRAWPPASAASGAPAAELSQDAAASAPLIKAPAAPRKSSRARPRAKGRAKRSRRPAAPKQPEPAAQAQAPSSPGDAQAEAQAHSKPAATPYELQFLKDKNEMTPDAEKILAQVAETVAYYPLEHLDLVGYAHSAEADAAALAQKRAQLVAGLLINKYKADPKKIQMHSSISETPNYKVEVRFIGDQ